MKQEHPATWFQITFSLVAIVVFIAFLCGPFVVPAVVHQDIRCAFVECRLEPER